MLKLLRKLMSANKGPARPTHRSKRPASATSDILARRTVPSPSQSRKAADGLEFDPYNTGAFDRASSWERINKRDF